MDHVLELSHLRSEVGELRAELAHVSSTMSQASPFTRSRSVDAFRARLSEPQEMCSGAAAMTAAHHLQRGFASREGTQSSAAGKRRSLGSCTSARTIYNTPTKVDRSPLQNPYTGFSPLASRPIFGRRAATPRQG